MATYVGLDIGTNTITGAVLSGTPKRFRLKDFFVQEIPRQEVPDVDAEILEGGDAGPPSVSQLIEKILTERGLKAIEVVAGVDAKDCIIREIVVPFTKDEHIRKTIHSEAEDHFQTFDIEDVQLEFYKLEELEEKSRVVIAAVKNVAIQDRLEVLKEGGVDPIAMDLDAAALFNAFALTSTFDPDRSVMLIDMGATSTKVLLLEKGQLKKIRSIRMHAGATRSIAQPVTAGAAARTAAGALPAPDSHSMDSRFLEIESSLSWLEAEVQEQDLQGVDGEEPIAILTDEELQMVGGGLGSLAGDGEESPPIPEGGGGEAPAGGAGPAGDGPYGDPLAASASEGPQVDYDEYLQRLGIEIQRTFATTLVTGGVDVICLTGGMSHREEARQFFTREFDVETVNLDFGDQFSMDIPAEAQDDVSRVGAVAVGLAVKELGGDRVGFDFRKNQFRFERKFERMKYPILLLSILLCLLFLQSFYVLYLKHVFYGRQVDEIQREERRLYQEFFEEKNSSELLLQQANLKKRSWESHLGQGGANMPVFIPFVEAMDEITMAIQQTKATDIQLRNLKLQLKTSQRPGKARTGVNSTIILETMNKEVGTNLPLFFKKIFTAKVNETVSPDNWSKLTVTLTPRPQYLKSLRK